MIGSKIVRCRIMCSMVTLFLVAMIYPLCACDLVYDTDKSHIVSICPCVTNFNAVCVCDGVSSNFCFRCFHYSFECPKFGVTSQNQTTNKTNQIIK